MTSMNSLQKISFAWASTIIGSVGVTLLVSDGRLLEGVLLIVFALWLEVAREFLKKYAGIEIPEDPKTSAS